MGRTIHGMKRHAVMAKQLRNKVAAARGVQRLAVQATEGGTRGPAQEARPVGRGVHTVRKQLKKVRASLRLPRPGARLPDLYSGECHLP